MLLLRKDLLEMVSEEKEAAGSDRRICLRIRGRSPAVFWYVIEEKPTPTKEKLEEEQKIKKQKTVGGGIGVTMTPLGRVMTVHESKVDRIRALQVPDLGHDLNFSSLAVVDTRLYLFGGYKRQRTDDVRRSLDPETDPLNGYLYLNLEEDAARASRRGGWGLEGSRCLER